MGVPDECTGGQREAGGMRESNEPIPHCCRLDSGHAYTLSSSINAVNCTQRHISERIRLVASQKKDAKAAYSSAIFFTRLHTLRTVHTFTLLVPHDDVGCWKIKRTNLVKQVHRSLKD